MMRPLSHYGRLAEQHWREFLPKRVAELEAKGQLHAMLLDAEDRPEAAHTQTDLTQLLAPAQVPLPTWVVPVLVKTMPKPRFELGELHVTAAAAEAIPPQEVLRALRRPTRALAAPGLRSLHQP